MTGLLLYGDTERNAALRHELPLAIIDPLVLVELDGRCHILTSRIERDRIARVRPDAELLEIHEAPYLGLAGAEQLVAGDVVAVEPGLHRDGLGMVRFEDLLLITDSGAENLTDFPYELV